MGWLFTLVMIVGIQSFFWFLALRFRTDKFTDLAYWVTFLLIIRWLYVWYSDYWLIQTILVFFVTFWSLRLALYLFLRVLALGKDKRFDGIREQKRAFIKFWLGQAVVIFLLLVPLVIGMLSESMSMRWYTRVWLLLFLSGFLLESIADRQKFRFKQQYPTRRCAVWVWKKIQYPNYLGEMLVWIGIYLICLVSLQWFRAVVWLISPFTLIRLLLFVTWIPPLELAHKKQRWTEKEWMEYTANTPKLIPSLW